MNCLKANCEGDRPRQKGQYRWGCENVVCSKTSLCSWRFLNHRKCFLHCLPFSQSISVLLIPQVQYNFYFHGNVSFGNKPVWVKWRHIWDLPVCASESLPFWCLKTSATFCTVIRRATRRILITPVSFLLFISLYSVIRSSWGFTVLCLKLCSFIY